MKKPFMQFDLSETIQILEKTPAVLRALLEGLNDKWIYSDEGQDTWSPYDVLGHLIEGEKTDWIPRMNIILSEHPNKVFKPFDRFAQLGHEVQDIESLLDEFEKLRKTNLELLEEASLDQEKLGFIGIHPEFGEVSLQELLATWAVHDLNHIGQIVRVMAKQYKKAIGPWTAYIGIVNKLGWDHE
jgi:hypothetical protein